MIVYFLTCFGITTFILFFCAVKSGKPGPKPIQKIQETHQIQSTQTTSNGSDEKKPKEKVKKQKSTDKPKKSKIGTPVNEDDNDYDNLTQTEDNDGARITVVKTPGGGFKHAPIQVQ
uniref:Uncharacterized protein n=1 Tax=Panagrolaimus sp. JU765 TaxID=591449 RepID=A0AC34RFB6_9BILA